MTVVEGPGRRGPPRDSDELPYQWDQLQYEYGEGPCLEAAATNGVELASDLRTENRWPLFARAIVDQTPVRSMLSFRLFLTEQNRAALNLYATEAGGVHRAVHRDRVDVRRVRLDGVARRGPHMTRPTT